MLRSITGLAKVFPVLSLLAVAISCGGAEPNQGGPSGGSGGNAGTGGAGGMGAGSGGSGNGGSGPSCEGPSAATEPPEQLYVAPDGDDSAAGTEAAPLASLAEAAARFSAGGTVIVRGGTYGQQRFDAKGTPEHPLVIRAATGETPIFDGADIVGTWSAVIQLYSAENVVLQGLEIRNCAADGCSGIDSAPVTNLTVRGCHIHDIDSSGARFTGKKIRLEGNHIHDVALTNVDNVNYPNGGWPTCMGTTPDRDNPQAPHADDVVIRDNVIEDCWGEGIGVWFASNAVVERNVVDNAFNVGIYMDNSFGVTIGQNFVHMTRGFKGGQGSGILMGTEPYASWNLAPASSHDITITNNVLVAGGGIGWWASSEGTDANDYHRVDIVHNTVIATKGGAISFDQVDAAFPAPDACTAKNNVFIEASDSDLGNASSWSFGGNAWLNKPKPAIAGSTDVSIDASIGAVTKADDVAPLAAIVGAGEAGTGVEIDFVCKPRSATAPTRGAFEP